MKSKVRKVNAKAKVKVICKIKGNDFIDVLDQTNKLPIQTKLIVMIINSLRLAARSLY